jgi:superfamily II DNA or RNA helicase
MSRLVEFRNRIYHRFRREWLSPSQEQAYTRLKNLLVFQDAINLYGPSGSGKTFMTWVLAKETSSPICFLTQPKQIVEQSLAENTVAIADPHSPERLAIRATLTQCRQAGCRKVIFVSDEPTTDQIPICQLFLTKQDLEKIHQNWESIAIPVQELQEATENLNLHMALREIALNSLNLTGR